MSEHDAVMPTFGKHAEDWEDCVFTEKPIQKPPLVKSVTLECGAWLRLWEPSCGQLITVQMPEGRTEEEYRATAKGLEEWYQREAAYFKGAKLVGLVPGYKVDILSQEDLARLGYFTREAMEQAVKDAVEAERERVASSRFAVDETEEGSIHDMV